MLLQHCPPFLTFNFILMNIQNKINGLKYLIEDWEVEHKRLQDMINIWNSSEDPSCDPGLQFEQEELVEHYWKRILKFCEENIVTK